MARKRFRSTFERAISRLWYFPRFESAQLAARIPTITSRCRRGLAPTVKRCGSSAVARIAVVGRLVRPTLPMPTTQTCPCQMSRMTSQREVDSCLPSPPAPTTTTGKSFRGLRTIHHRGCDATTTTTTTTATATHCYYYHDSEYNDRKGNIDCCNNDYENGNNNDTDTETTTTAAAVTTTSPSTFVSCELCVANATSCFWCMETSKCVQSALNSSGVAQSVLF